MRFRFFTLPALLLLIPASRSPAIQDFSIQGSNEAKWAQGEENIAGITRDADYLENRLNLDLYSGNLRLGARCTLLDPSEFGEERSGLELLEKRFLEYTGPRGDLHVRVGDFYTVWGRGLTLALVEDITQGFDSGLNGVLVGGVYDGFELEGLYGFSRADYLGQVDEAGVAGAHLGVNLPNGFSSGIQGIVCEPVEDTVAGHENNTYGTYMALDRSTYSLWAEHAVEEVAGVDDDHYATYLSGSWYGSGLGIAVDYKRYRYNLRGGGYTGAGSIYARSAEVLPFYNAPVVQREFTSLLLGRHPHIVRFEDEVGLQVELTWSATDLWTLILQAGQSSSFSKKEGWLPTFNEEDSPFRELFFEANAFPLPGWYLTGWLGANEDLIYYDGDGVRARVSWQRRFVVGTANEVELLRKWSLSGSTEFGQVENVDLEKSFVEGLFMLGLNWGTDYSLAVTVETSGEEDPVAGRSAWVKLDGRAMVADRHELLITIGRERGGLVCTSGRCRLVAPFNGVKITLTSLL